jgi:HEAT repeat protein
MESIRQLVEQLGSNDSVKAYKAHQSLVQSVTQAGRPGNDKERAAVAAGLAEELIAVREEKDRQGKTIRNPKYSAKVRRQILRWIGCVAGETEVPALKRALDDLETREMARWALEQIPGAAATKALIDAAVNGVGAEFRVGAINSLGRRPEPEAVAALKGCAADADVEIRLTAAEALANFPDPALDAVITAAVTPRGEEFQPRTSQRLSRARLRLAETLMAAGQKDASKRIYQAILAGNVDEPQKKAARRTLQQFGNES